MDEEGYDLGGRSNKKRNILECTTTFLFTPPKCDMSKRFKLRLTNFIAAKTIGYSRINNQLFHEHREILESTMSGPQGTSLWPRNVSHSGLLTPPLLLKCWISNIWTQKLFWAASSSNWNYKKYFNTVKFFEYIKKNNALHLLRAAFCLLVRLWRKKGDKRHEKAIRDHNLH